MLLKVFSFYHSLVSFRFFARGLDIAIIKYKFVIVLMFRGASDKEIPLYACKQKYDFFYSRPEKHKLIRFQYSYNAKKTLLMDFMKRVLGYLFSRTTAFFEKYTL